MPGICGIATVKKNGEKGIDKTLFAAMLESLSYGRSKANESFIGSNIIMGCSYIGQAEAERDKSKVKVFESEKATVCFYGYLFTPAPKERHSKSEAEYVHDHYLNTGESFVNEIDGSFVIAIFDKLQNELLLCNSRFGALPMYYAMSRQGLIFASEVKALLQDTTLSRHLDDFAVADFFCFGRILGDKTFFQEIHSLPHASILRYQNGAYSIKQYWELVFPETYPKKSDEYYENLIYEAISEAVNRVIEPGKRYGLLLSGGRDSRWLAALLSEHSSKILGFTHVTPGSKDVELAKVVAEKLEIEHHLFSLTPAYYSEYSERIAYTLDGMVNIRECFALQEAMNAHNYVDTLITGFIGGELFGKARPAGMRVKSGIDSLRYPRRCILIDSEMELLFGKEMKAKATKSLEESMKSAKSNIPANVVEYHNLISQQKYSLLNAESAWNPYIETCSPFLARQVIEAALQLPPKQKVYEQAYSRSFCSHFPTLADLSFYRPTILPSSAKRSALIKFRLVGLARRIPLLKKAFPLPKFAFADWLRGPLKPFVEEILLGKEANRLGLFNQQYLQTLIDEHMSGKRDLNFFIFLLLTFELWCRMFYYPSVPKLPESMRAEGN